MFQGPGQLLQRGAGLVPVRNAVDIAIAVRARRRSLHNAGFETVP